MEKKKKGHNLKMRLKFKAHNFKNPPGIKNLCGLLLKYLFLKLQVEKQMASFVC